MLIHFCKNIFLEVNTWIAHTEEALRNSKVNERETHTHRRSDRNESNSLHIIHSRAALSTRSPLSITHLTWMQTRCYTKERAALISSSLNQCLRRGDKEKEWLSLKTGEDVCYRTCTWPDTRMEISTPTPDWEALWDAEGLEMGNID